MVCDKKLAKLENSIVNEIKTKESNQVNDIKIEVIKRINNTSEELINIIDNILLAKELNKDMKKERTI